MDLSGMAAVDQHAHPVMPRVEDFAACFSEGPRDARDTLFFQRSMRDLGTLMDCEPIESCIAAKRESLGADALAQLCFEKAALHTVLLDDGYPQGAMSLDWHAQFVAVRRVLRLETLAESLLADCRDVDEFSEKLRHQLETADVAAFKSIAAYRCGLDLPPPEGDVLPPPGRLTDDVFISYVLHMALEIAARRGLPVQLHTGFGDVDLDLRASNPLHLRSLLEQHPEARLVLLHASWPYAREASWMASVYPHVYLDFGLAIPFLSVHCMRQALHELLSLAPFSKIMYSSDASRIPELFYLGARYGRAMLGDVLEATDDLSASEKEKAARAMLGDNARRLYRL